MIKTLLITKTGHINMYRDMYFQGILILSIMRNVDFQTEKSN